ncbi:glycosyltransferase [Vibrio cyclitrophicus]
MKLAIIVINYNNNPGLINTLGSIQNQDSLSDLDYQVIIVDGGSTDGSLGTIAEFDELLDVQFSSEADKGIYDAMNKGLERLEASDCTHFMFLNSGDYFSCTESLSFIYDGFTEGEKIVFFKTKNFYENLFTYRPVSNSGKFFFGKVPSEYFPCHQSVICRKEILDGLRFDDELKISADTKFLNELFSRYKSHYIPFYLVNFELGGVSNYYHSYKHYINHAREKISIAKSESLLFKTKTYIFGAVKLVFGRLLGKRRYFKIYLSLKNVGKNE